jgi:hypothetical protein
MAGLLERVRTTCAAVAERAGSVHIQRDRLAAYAAALPLEQLPVPQWDTRFHYLGPLEPTIAFVLTLDAINFGSGYFPALHKPAGRSGYFTIASALTERFRARGPFSAAELARLSAADCAELFGQQPDGPVAELMELFARALNDLGVFLLERFHGRFTGPVEASAGSAARLAELLTAMPLYRDVAHYHGFEVAFYKRAQLTAADLALALEGRPPAAFGDLDRLTIFADNLVPHVLRVDGILRYDPALAARIDAGQLIAAGSPEEVEIRASAVAAVELLVAELRGAGHAVNAMQLDQLLWNRGQQPTYKAIPRHRARGTFY